MNSIYEMKLPVTPGYCDASGKLGYHEAFRIFMDAAAIHAQLLGIGMKEMSERNLFWLTVKTKVCFYRRPFMGEVVTIRTWPEAPEKIRCLRSYEIRKGEELLAAAKTEWAVLDMGTNRVVPMENVYPGEIDFPETTACAGPFARVADEFAPEDMYEEYRVSSADIDVGGHMNNSAYVRAVMGSLSNEEIKGLRIKEIDAVFRAPCFEGENLSIQKKKTEEGTDVRVSRDGQTVLLMRIQ